MCSTTVVPLHVATDHGDFMYHGNKPALLSITFDHTCTSLQMWYLLITDSTVNESTADSVM